MAVVGGRSERLLPWAGLGAALLYFMITRVLEAHPIGLHYDEALYQHGAVQMLHSASEPTFAHQEGSWVSLAGRHWPLVIIYYVGAIKDYLLLLPFALFGSSAKVARLVNALLGAFGIWGIARLLRHEISAAVAAVVALIIAVNPNYIGHTLFDCGGVVVWMAILGMLSIAIVHYKKRRTAMAAFFIGLSMGIGNWNRLNFSWFLGSVLVAALIAFRKRLWIPIRHIAAAAAGSLVGVFPMLWFQIRSRWAIVEFMKGVQVQESPGRVFLSRILMIFSGLFISDPEQREIWNGPSGPVWQLVLFPTVVLFSLVVCLALKGLRSENDTAWRRAAALTFVIFALLLLTSRLLIEYHHLVMLLPIAAIVVVLAFRELMARWRRAGAFALAIAFLYGASASYWDFSLARGIERTGGVGIWSNAIYQVNDRLNADYAGREIRILDWGLQNNLFVLSNAKLKSIELFWGATTERSGGIDASWSELVAAGGVYLSNADSNLHMPEATRGFWAALAASKRPYKLIEFRQGSGERYAQLIEVDNEPSRH